jgi:hypothetical protein
MCFSATASVVAAATLIPVGVYCMRISRKEVPGWLMLAAFPLAFGMQQGIEGAVWFGVNTGNQLLVSIASQCYVFFSHFFWLFWVPFSVYYMEKEGVRKRLVGALAIFGLFFGLSLFLPLILKEGWLAIEIVQHSLLYKTITIYDGIMSRQVVRGIYAMQVFLALVLATNLKIRAYGILIQISVLVTFVFYKYAFVSVWCFFAGFLSIYLLIALQSERRQVNKALIYE